MKKLMLTIVLCPLFVFAMGKRPPAKPTKPLRPSGEVFEGTGSSNSQGNYNDEDAKGDAEYGAHEECKSGKATRVTGWSIVHDGTATFPGDCKKIDGREYCTPSKTYYIVKVSAKFQCK